MAKEKTTRNRRDLRNAIGYSAKRRKGYRRQVGKKEKQQQHAWKTDGHASRIVIRAYRRLIHSFSLVMLE